MRAEGFITKVTARYQMRYMLPSIVFFLVAFTSSLALIQTTTGPNVYATNLKLHSSSESWLSVMTTPANIQSFLTGTTISPDAVIRSLNVDDEAPEVGATKFEQISALIDRNTQLAKRRNTTTVSMTIKHNDMAIVRSFVSPYLAHLHENYYETWLQNFRAAENNERQIATNVPGEVVINSELPVASLVEFQTVKSLLNGSPIVRSPTTEQGLRFGVLTISLLAFLAGLIATAISYLIILYKNQFMRLVFGGEVVTATTR